VNFQDIISRLNQYWSKRDCAILQPCGREKSSALFAPAAFFGALAGKPFSAAWTEVCRRPGDSRYGDDPVRLGAYYQYQVMIKPPDGDLQRACLDSLRAVGIKREEHDIRWIEAGREDCPCLDISGAGWEVRLDGMSVARFTYLQRLASVELSPSTVEISYGLERLALLSQKKSNILELAWNDRLSYGGLHRGAEKQFSRYALEFADPGLLRRDFEAHFKEAGALLGHGLYLPAFDLFLKCAHCFDLLAAREAVPGAELPDLGKRMRELSAACAAACTGDKGDD